MYQLTLTFDINSFHNLHTFISTKEYKRSITKYKFKILL